MRHGRRHAARLSCRLSPPQHFPWLAGLAFRCEGASMENAISTYGYVSRSRVPIAQSDTEISRIVEVSRRNNATNQITGALISAGAFFAQVVEGAVEPISVLRDRLEADPRHGALLTIDLRPRTRRNFAGWALAYAGGSSYFESFLKAIHDGSAHVGDVERLESMLREFATGDE